MQTFFDAVRYRFILSNLVAKEFKTQYRSMALGYLWAILQPLVLVTVLSVVWIVFFGQRANFATFVIVALIPYNFIAYSLPACTTAVVANRSLVKKVRFPRQILPISVVITHAIHFAIQSVLVLIALVAFPPDANILGMPLLWLPFVVGVQLGLAIGAGLLLAALNVVYRDIQYLVGSIMVVLFWVSPILYDAHDRLIAGENTQTLPWWVALAYYLNPLAGILEAYRAILYFGRSPDPATFGLAVVVTLVMGILGVRTFWRHEREFADLV